MFRGIWRGTEVAIKLMLEQDLTVENMQDFCNEISLLRFEKQPVLQPGVCWVLFFVYLSVLMLLTGSDHADRMD